MEENKYSEIIKSFTFEQLVYERAIVDKEKANIYIKVLRRKWIRKNLFNKKF